MKDCFHGCSQCTSLIFLKTCKGYIRMDVFFCRMHKVGVMSSCVTLGFLKDYESGCGRDLWMILNLFIKNLSGKTFCPS